MKKRFLKNRAGLTLPELMVAVVILALTVTGILVSYLRCMQLNEISNNMSLAVQVAKSKMEDMKTTAFTQIKTTYNNVSFAVTGLNGRGVSYVDDTNAKLLKLTVTICFKESNKRVIGEDKDLDGVLDAGDDTNGNGMLDSPVELVSYIYDR